MGRTVGQQWFGETEESPGDTLQSLPGLMGWERLWDSSGMVGLRGWEGLWDSSGMVGAEESPWDSLLSLPGLRGREGL